jgi:hypothetical protein
MEKAFKASSTSQTFEDMRKEKIIYVDKTAYLANMIDSEEGNDVFFLARPRRFGKSLTVSTFDAIFSGQKELFKGLAIEKNLDDEKFAPRPVIHLDMSTLTFNKGADEFEMSLRRITAKIADRFDIVIPVDIPAKEILYDLVEKSHNKFNQKVVILIDEYDSPVTNLLYTPEKADPIREELRYYYMQLKALDKHIAFIFVTGITKFVQGGLYSAFNNPTDISFMPEYGALTGFTHEEIEKYYSRQITNTAEELGMSPNLLLEKMKDYYNGFCFDEKTLVYNPFSTVLFFDRKLFRNFWFYSGSPDHLITFFKKTRLTVDQFRGDTISCDSLENPSSDTFIDPAVYLFQLGYLSLRPGPATDFYTLDYPNTEVKQSMARRLLESYFKGSSVKASNVWKNLQKAVTARDPAALVEEFNKLLSAIPYDDYNKESQTDSGVVPSNKSKETKRDESWYRSSLFALVYAAALDPRAEVHGNLGRADIILSFGDQVWVLELKVRHHDDSKDEILAKNALKQIYEKNYAGSFDDPVLLGLVINDEDRLIKAWECRGGLAERPIANSAVEKKNKDAEKKDEKEVVP